jgi:hypothetical protein
LKRVNNSCDASAAIALNLMLPNAYDFPAAAPKLAKIAFVAGSVAVNFFPPEWLQLVFPAREPVTVPEVAIDENGQFPFGKNQVGTSRECPHVSSKSNAPESELTTNQKLDIGSVLPNARH